MKTIRGGTRSQLHDRVLPGVPLFGKWEKIRGGTRSQLRRPLFPLGLPLVGHAEKHVIKGQEIDEWRYRWIFESRGNG